MYKNILKRVVPMLVAMLAGTGAWADAPAGYYTSLNGKKNGELKTAIYNLVHNFTQVSSYSALPSYFQQTDVYPESRRWWDMYSNDPHYAPSFSGMNREHSFPKSWWGGSTTVSAYVDLNHLYPAEAVANQAKSNYPLGVVDTRYSTKCDNGVTLVGYPVAGQGGGASFVFEPDDEYKGDFARTYFYMVTCYQDLTWKYTYMVNQNLFPTLNVWSAELLMKWHRMDPVSQKEIDRNEAVYRIQNNRNPFIDHPELAEYLWGTKVGQNYQAGSVVEPPVGDPTLFSPVQDMTLEFGEVALGNSAKARLYFRGENLTGNLAVTLYSGDKGMFKLPASRVDYKLVNSADGYWLTLTYNPTELGEHTSKLIVSEGGIVGSVGVTLRGQCLPKPVLTACTATEATDIQEDSYVANWTAPEGEVIDYYVVTRTAYTNGTAVTTEINAEDNFCEINGFASSDSEAYSVQSVRLGERSPMSNVIFVQHAGVTGVLAGSPLALYPLAGGLRIICSDIHTDLTVYDVSGRAVVTMDRVDCNTDIYLPAGIYFVTTAQHPAPLKAVVR